MFKHFKLFLIFLTTLSFTFFIWSLITTIFLAKVPTSLNNISKNTNFYNIHLEKIFTSEIKKIKHKTIIKPKIETLKGIILKAIFENGENSFIIIQSKTDIFLDLNKKYKGYTLIKITQNSAIFSKNHKQFEIKLNKNNIQPSNIVAKTDKKQINNETEMESEIKEIKKETLTKYIQNPSQIWKNIAINKTKKGYKVIYIKPNSIFSKLGLKKEDYILEVNNKKLLNDADAWQIYKNIKSFEDITIKIKRNNSTKELNYEIF